MILGMNTSKLYNQQKQIELELVSFLWLDLTNGISGRISMAGVHTGLISISDLIRELIDFLPNTRHYTRPSWHADDLGNVLL